jgi:hypothetical protein
MLTIPELVAARQQFRPVDCPHCGTRLNTQFRVVIPTRHCPRCGRRVAAEPEADGAPPYTREQLDAACAAYARANSRFGWLVLAACLAFLVNVVVIAFFRDAIHDAVRPVTDPGWVMLLAVFWPILVLMTVAFIILGRATRAALKCPKCARACSAVGSPRATNLTSITGNCVFCGHRLLNEPAPEEPAGPLPTVQEFRAAEKRLAREGKPAAYLMSGLLLAMVIGFVVGLSHLMRYQHTLENRLGEVRGAIAGLLLNLLAALAGGAVMILVVRLYVRRVLRRHAGVPVLNCPHCREKLSSFQHVVATRRCSACRKCVLAEPVAVGVAEESPRG